MLFHRPKTGTVEGTGAAISVSLGFQPKIVKLWNIDGNSSALVVRLEWNETMGSGKGVKTISGKDATADTVSLMTFISSGGITASYGGFSIGTDSDVNVSGKTIIWEAV